MKLCCMCKLTKELSAFGRDRHKRDGLTVTCKSCSQLVRRGHRAPPRPIVTERVCSVCDTLKPMLDYYKHSRKCKKCISVHNHACRVPKQRVLSLNSHSVYVRSKRQSNPLFRLRSTVSTLVANSLVNNGYSKKSRTASILGCSFEQFHDHIQSQFTVGMTWDNRSLWHIDHVIPLAFACNEQELLMLNHYTNLRPIWAADNLAKGKSIVDAALEHPLYKTIIQNRIPG